MAVKIDEPMEVDAVDNALAGLLQPVDDGLEELIQPMVDEMNKAKDITEEMKALRIKNEQEKGVLEVVKLTERAKSPTRGSPDCAGYDLYSAYDYQISPNDLRLIKTDLILKPPKGTYLHIAPRSSLASKYHLSVGAGVVDPDYRGNCRVLLYNHSEVPYFVNTGDRIAQIICEKIASPIVKIVEELDETARGEGAFGSSGTN